MTYPHFPSPAPGTAADPKRPRHWVGKGDPARSDERQRELLLLGTYPLEGPLSLDRFFAFELEGYSETSLHWLLGERTAGPELVLADDVAVARVAQSFDLPPGASPAGVASTLAKLATGQQGGLRALARLQNAFASVPFLFEELWARAGGGQPIKTHPFEADPSTWETGSAGKTLKIAGRAFHQSADLEKRLGPRQQLFGARVLHGDLGSCPQCGGPMIRTAEGPRCQRDWKRMQYTPPDDSEWLFGDDPR